ncbi:single-stranded-DNA-specific exonuclease RecJ [Desulfoplanes formicivorans]|uniref:Single-stranded-DNA-specific exonuclease RecJ n=1 Tax=Desulfoplanes formicivorans TaxID=1592317 RepID=A0A194AEG9_9BACT|nr:single-stranded-DNA-specific exonuclease RecJ [Desulfoplanes formicivorans]GAU07516.1 single-stranded DNA exonuclease [Desulfoplanes formicivorans]
MHPLPDNILFPSPLCAAEQQLVRSLARDLGITELTASILFNRGLRDQQAIQRFLDPGLRHLSALENWPGLIPVAERLAAHIAQGEKIAVWGDYDVDGVTATALVTDFFKRKNLSIIPVLPSRFEHGYGLDGSAIRELALSGIQVLLTVDCGISDHQAVDVAKSLGMTVIITDHHLPGPVLPAADGIFNPQLQACPCPHLAGVGVAFLLMAALNRILPPPIDIRPLLDFVALGTIADIVPLTGENRILVKNGLLVLKSDDRPGIAALKGACSLESGASIGSGDVGFGLAPRINAAGRLDTARTAFDLLMADSANTAKPLANRLNKLNAQRKTIEQHIVDQALELLAENDQSFGHVLFDPAWHQGVLGIAASRVTEQTYRPTILLSDQGDVLKGSGRSVPGIDLFTCLKACEDLLEGFGGHVMAAGLSVHPDNLAAFRERFNAAVSEQCHGAALPRPKIKIDAEVPFDHITPVLLAEIESLQPFGPANPRPVFLSPVVTVRSVKPFSRNRHLAFELRDESSNITFRALAWRQGSTRHYQQPQGARVRIAFTPKLTTYRGLVGIELIIKELFA